jgi:tRNA (guanine-N7-)-methyltransferase
MSFGLGRGRELDDAPGVIGVSAADLPPLPDDVAQNPHAARIDPRRWFSDPALPLEIEIGSGKGTFLLDAATQNPRTNFLGIEWAREFYLYTADRIRRRGLANVRVLNTDATEFLRWRCPDEIARVIHLYFSDPWPKRKHHRRRVVQDAFLGESWRILEPGGELRIVTDHDEYWDWMQEHFARWTKGMSDVGCRSPRRLTCGEMSDVEHGEPPSGASEIQLPTSDMRYELLPFAPPATAGEGELIGTNFERKYRREARPFHAAVLRKPPPPDESQI